MHRVKSRWNLLDQGAVDATSVNAFKDRLNKLRDDGSFSWISPPSRGPPGGIPAGEATQGMLL